MISERTPLLPSLSLPKRIPGIDLLRGLLMVFESLDHAREILSTISIKHEEWFEMPQYTKTRTFLVRLVTSLSAPGFMFLMGFGVVLFGESRRIRDWNEARISKHFFIRGALLLLLNFIQMPLLGLPFFPIATVLYALALNIVLASLIASLELYTTSYLATILTPHSVDPHKHAFAISATCYAIASISITSIVTILTNESPIITKEGFGTIFDIIRETFSLYGPVYAIYTPLPWLPLVLHGVLLARYWIVYLTIPSSQIRCNAALSGILMFLFLLFRASGVGNIHTELLGGDVLDSPINFLNLVKYPPSLTFVLFTMSINHGLLALFLSASTPSLYNPLSIYGSSALFFYFAHFYVYSIIRKGLELFGVCRPDKGGFFGGNKAGGLELWGFLVWWVVGLVALYGMCERYGRFKKGRGPESIWRFF